jgi:hypothetical protein
VQFFDFSDNAASLCWSFGDGKNSSCCPNPKHTFCCPGNYTVSLTAENDNGSSSTFIVITVMKPTNQSSTEDSANSDDTVDPGSGRRNESTCIERILSRKNLESMGNFIFSFTGIRSLAEPELSVEREILRLVDTVRGFTEYSVPRIEARNISMRVLFFGFLGIGLGLSVFRRRRK